ncbi:hypothetical protein AB0904_27770 [Streptomyces sp. NPDC006684]|uniref:hypothetical protein n=1 Tax=Streptomyces sp. NPDC006684 TaxID=3154477 RepID=UPI003451454A
MNDKPKPITPTRIIPGGAPLPGRAPQPGELPPWRTPPPPPRPPATPPVPPPPPAPVPPPAPIEVRVTVDLAPPAEIEEERPGALARLWAQVASWRLAVAAGAALLPWLGGSSPATAWAHTVHTLRAEAGLGAAYTVAGLALGGAVLVYRHSSGRSLPTFFLITASVGALGVLDWWDPIVALTGVPR